MQQLKTVSGNVDCVDHFGTPSGLFGQVAVQTRLTKITRKNILYAGRMKTLSDMVLTCARHASE